MYKDTTIEQSLGFILSNRQNLNFSKFNNLLSYRNSSPTVWWYEFSLINSSDRTKNLILEVTDLDLQNCELFILRNDKTDIKTTIKHDFSLDQKPIQHRYALYPITMTENEEVVCYLKVKKKYQSLNAQIQLWDKITFIESNGHRSITYGIFIGLGLTFLSILLVAAFILYTKRLLYYFIYFSLVFLFFLFKEGFIYQVNLPFGNPNIYSTIQFILPFFATIVLILIGEEFLNHFSENKIPISIYKWIKKISLIIIPITSVAYFFELNSQFAQTFYFLIPFLNLILIFLSIGLLLASITKEILTQKKIEFIEICLINVVHILLITSLYTVIYFRLFENIFFKSGVLMTIFIMEILTVAIIILKNYQTSNKERIQLSLLNSQQELEVSNTLLKGQKQERALISENMKHELNPLLNELSILFREKYKLEKPSILGQKILNHFKRSKHEVIRIAKDLNPEILFSKNLIKNIENLCVQIEEVSEFDILFSSNNIEHRFSDFQKINIYRIIQELLNNAVKHAFATGIKIEIIELSDEFLIFYEDNGIGISNMQQRFSTLSVRTENLKGEINIIRRKEPGLKIRINIPLADEV